MTWRNEINKNANGGTELQMEALYNALGEDYLNKFQIIPSRVRGLDETKPRILWLHDLPVDPESKHLQNEGWRKFNKIVCVSNWQLQQYMGYFGIPWSKTLVLPNAIEPIEYVDKPSIDEQINIVYHTTPHRGLELLVPCIEELAEKYPNIHLHVFSSFNIYGWGERDEPFKDMFEHIKNNKNMTYYGSVSNKEMKEHLKKMHIFAYPSIWPETSCIALIEAMSAGLVCVHPNFAALYETAGGWTQMYHFNEDFTNHKEIFKHYLSTSIEMLLDKDMKQAMQMKLAGQKTYADLFFNWNIRKNQWAALLKSLENADTTIEKVEDLFVYKPIG